MSWTDVEATLWHWQDRDGAEVDLVLEAADGRVLAMEVKTSASPQQGWFKWLARLRDRLGDDFVHGLVLHTGKHTLPFGDRLTATPISTLWSLTG